MNDKRHSYGNTKTTGMRSIVGTRPGSLPVIILADVSRSMAKGGKINALNQAISNMLAAFADHASQGVLIDVAVITFGGRAKVHMDLQPAESIRWQAVIAGGISPLGRALELAVEMIEDTNKISPQSCRPILIVISDGRPNGNPTWQQGMATLLKSSRASKVERLALATSEDQEEQMLREFAGEKRVFRADSPKQIDSFFQWLKRNLPDRARTGTSRTMIHRALLVGINGYASGSGLSKLDYAEKDAQDMARAMGDFGFRPDVLTGEIATARAVKKALRNLGGGDTLVFYFAGHGSMIGGAYCLHPVNDDESGLEALVFSTLVREFERQKAFKRVLMILDACRAGRRGVRGSGHGIALSGESQRNVQAAVRKTSRVEILFGCEEGEVSHEVKKLENGLFTHALIQVMTESDEMSSDELCGKAADWIKEWQENDPKHRYQQPWRDARPSYKEIIRLARRPLSGPAEPTQ